jgi:hypothetical protein
LPSDRQLKHAVADLRAMERKCFGSRQRFGFYRYLAEVFEFYQHLRRDNEAKISARRIAELFGIRKQKRTHPIRVIIDVTSAADEKTKSRWTRALRYAWHQRNRWKNLKMFFRSSGGAVGAARQFAALHPRSAKRRASTSHEGPGLTMQPLPGVERIMPGHLFVRDGRVFRQPDVTETQPQENDYDP